MAQISRLKDPEIENGNAIDADDLDGEFDQLVSAHNTNDTELTAIGTGTYTFAGVKTFSSTPKMNAIDERTGGSGVTIDGLVLIKDGYIIVPAGAGFTPATNGQLGYDSTSHTYDVYVNGAAKALLHTGSGIDDLNDVTITTPSSGQTITYNGSAWVNGSKPLIILQDQKTANTAGGTFTSGSWQTRTLNTEVTDTASICSLATNQFTLPAGTYDIEASAPALRVGRHQIRLQNITDTSTTLIGESAFSDSTVEYATTRSRLVGRFTIAGSKAFEIQHQCQTTRATFGFGLEANLGVTEIYTTVVITKVG